MRYSKSSRRLLVFGFVTFFVSFTACKFFFWIISDSEEATLIPTAHTSHLDVGDTSSTLSQRVSADSLSSNVSIFPNSSNLFHVHEGNRSSNTLDVDFINKVNNKDPYSDSTANSTELLNTTLNISNQAKQDSNLPRVQSEKANCVSLGLCPNISHANSCTRSLFAYAQNKTALSPYTKTSSAQSYVDMNALTWRKVYYIEGKVFTMKGSVPIIAVATDGKRRTIGGDNWAVFLHNDVAKITGRVEDHLNGTYTASFEVAETGEYDFIVQLSSGLNNKGSEVVENGECTLTEMRTLLHGDLDGITTVCAWEAIPTLAGLSMKPMFDIHKLKIDTIFPKYALPICRKGISDGRWLNIKSCTREKCSGPVELLTKFKWVPHIWTPYSCRYHMFHHSDSNFKICMQKLKLKGPVIVGGDSVSKLGFGVDMQLISDKLWPGAVQLHSIYSLQTLYNVGSFGKHKDGLTAKQKARLAVVMRKEVLQRKAFFSIMKTDKISHIIVGTGRHDIRNGQSISDFLAYGRMFARDLGHAQRRGVKAFWLNTAAPQARQPTHVDAERKECELGHHSVNCATGRDQCARFSQRFDRVRTMNHYMYQIFADRRLSTIDTFKITNAGIKDWHDDNIHHHEKAGGMSKMQAQMAWNVVCNNLR